MCWYLQYLQHIQYGVSIWEGDIRFSMFTGLEEIISQYYSALG